MQGKLRALNGKGADAGDIPVRSHDRDGARRGVSRDNGGDSQVSIARQATSEGGADAIEENGGCPAKVRSGQSHVEAGSAAGRTELSPRESRRWGRIRMSLS